jgi:radical SAM superfamily enzyme YgiQ (UPF0313 family)
MKKTILLIQPSYYYENHGVDISDDDSLDVSDKSIPLGVISIGSFLQARGVSVELLDCRFISKQDALDKISKHSLSYFAVGLSVMTGHLEHALKLTDHIKKNFPNLPIIWGGTHPTLYPEQTIIEPNIDYVIAGEGEHPIDFLVPYLIKGEVPSNTVNGLLFKHEGNIVYTGEHAEPVDVATLPNIDYELCDVNKLLKVQLINGKIVRGLGVLTSRGCPYQCSFCPVPHLNSRKWRAISAEKVIVIVKKLVEKYRLDYVWFMDDFFFGNLDRFTKIVDGLLAENMNILWSGNVRVDNLSDKFLNDELLSKIKKSGCYALHMGMESGDDEILRKYKKGITTAQIENAVKKCHEYGIIPNGTWIMGIPGESLSSIKKTISFMWKLHQIDDSDLYYVPGIYRPYPGGELYQEALRSGYDEPKSLREWTKREFYVGFTSTKYLPWLKDKSIIRDFRFYGRLITAYRKGLFSKGILKILVIFVFLSKMRFRTGFWHIRFEAKIFNLCKTVVCKLFPQTYISKLLAKN